MCMSDISLLMLLLNFNVVTRETRETLETQKIFLTIFNTIICTLNTIIMKQTLNFRTYVITT